MEDLAIVICTINRAQFLRYSLECLKNQMVNNSFIIIVDDGSIDDTKTVVAEYSKKMKIQYIYNEKLQYSSPAKARNLGWRSANTKYISFTDPEVILKPNTIKSCLNYHKYNPLAVTAIKPIMVSELETVAFFSFEHRFDWLFSRDKDQFSDPENAQIQSRKSWRDNHFSMMKRKALEDVGGVNEKFNCWGFEGIDLIERILSKGYHLYNFIKEDLYVYHLWHEAPRDMKKANEQRIEHGIKNCGKQS